MENTSITILVASYNMEKYVIKQYTNIKEALSNAKIENYKIVYIDGYSKDNSVKIIKSIQEKDKNIMIIDKKKEKGDNSVVGSWKVGFDFVQNCDTEWVTHIDSDDLISPDYFLDLSSMNNYDLIIKRSKRMLNYDEKAIYDEKFYKSKGKSILAYRYSFWTKIVKVKVYWSMRKYFYDELLFSSKIFDNKDLKYFISTKGYYLYNIHENSLSEGYIKNREKYCDNFEKIVGEMETSINQLNGKNIRKYYLWQIFSVIYILCETKKGLEFCRRILKQYKVGIFYQRGITMKRWIYYLLIRIAPFWFVKKLIVKNR